MRNPVDKAINRIGSQERLAQIVGVSRQSAGYWLKKGEIPFKYLKDISKVTGIPVRDLMSKQQRTLVEGV